jgi:hypothetical protein
VAAVAAAGCCAGGDPSPGGGADELILVFDFLNRGTLRRQNFVPLQQQKNNVNGGRGGWSKLRVGTPVSIDNGIETWNIW